MILCYDFLVEEIEDHVANVYSSPDLDSRVCVVSGFGSSISVRSGHLMVRDGVGKYQRQRQYARTDSHGRNGLMRLVIVAASGSLSLEAVRWCDALNVSIVVLGRSNRVMLVSPGYLGDARVRRVQAYPPQGLAVRVFRELIREKIHGQRSLVSGWNSRSDRELSVWLDRIETASTVSELVSAEGHAASAYWQAWRNRVFLPFRLSDLGYIPGHWSWFGSRSGTSSDANGIKPTNRAAIEPLNGMLNFCYALCFAESQIAVHSAGLDPSFGFGHGLDKSSPGMILDLAEPLRSIADSVVLSMTDHGQGIPVGPRGKPAYISRFMFTEQPNGTVRLNPPLTNDLAALVTVNAAPIARDYAYRIFDTIADAGGITNPERNRPVDPRYANRVSGYRELDPAITTPEIIPDHVWEKIRHLIPPEPASQTYKPNPRVDYRSVLAGIVCHEIYGTSWSGIPFGLGVDRKTCRRRLAEWADVWPDIRRVITEPGITRFGWIPDHG